MAFALTRMEAYQEVVGSTSRKRGIQGVDLYITGTVADVDLDIGDYSGTFWTAALANSTLGNVATTALSTIQKIVAQVESLDEVNSQQLLDRIKIATVAGAGEYSLAIQNTLPNIAFFAGDGETSIFLRLKFTCVDGQFPICAQLGQGNGNY